jgi:hypothetical protein
MTPPGAEILRCAREDGNGKSTQCHARAEPVPAKAGAGIQRIATPLDPRLALRAPGDDEECVRRAGDDEERVTRTRMTRTM